ncbi:uncharacterized protein LY79DRAFT_585441 [Colletotrichum navitas]|uniref:Uncharacterized protein n=1 Tax=Colletotrichum navitas TaxID=681940 RepID=A0AAD8UUH2_9PEZI|nr:uncharacterized protein LY79DRAFT_585441 [Colletotrichum navitas]KAK1561661.1 hypothetical protein LY79DRAFT_585441 [Colletotrichum navitas]
MASESGDSFYASESSSTSQAEDSIINSSQISINTTSEKEELDIDKIKFINITSNEFNSLLSYLNNSSPTVNYRGLTKYLVYLKKILLDKLSYKDQEKVLKNNYKFQTAINHAKKGKEFPVNSYKTKIPLFTNLPLGNIYYQLLDIKALHTSKENQVDKEFY